MASLLASSQYLVACEFTETEDRIKGKEMSSRPCGYFGMQKDIAARYRCDYNPSFHYAIEINIKKPAVEI